jgi:hypothetical protein
MEPRPPPPAYDAVFASEVFVSAPTRLKCASCKVYLNPGKCDTDGKRVFCAGCFEVTQCPKCGANEFDGKRCFEQNCRYMRALCVWCETAFDDGLVVMGELCCSDMCRTDMAGSLPIKKQKRVESEHSNKTHIQQIPKAERHSDNLKGAKI